VVVLSRGVAQKRGGRNKEPAEKRCESYHTEKRAVPTRNGRPSQVYVYAIICSSVAWGKRFLFLTFGGWGGEKGEARLPKGKV